MRKKTYRLFRKTGLDGKWVLMKTENWDNIKEAQDRMFASGLTKVDDKIYENKFAQFYISEEQ